MDLRRISVVMTAVLFCALVAPAFAADSDGDGMPNRWERNHGLSPNRSNAEGDPDGDHLKNIDEYFYRGDPKDDDTDDDGISDGNEVRRWGTDVDQADAVVGLITSDLVCDSSGCGQRPLGGAELTLRSDEGNDISTFSNENGRFSFVAPKGRYSLTPHDVPAFVTPSPLTFNVRGGAVVVRFIYGEKTGLGLVGQVTQSPTCPGPQRRGEDCTEPLEGAPLRVEDQAGAIVARTTSSVGGRYYFDLDAGTYTLIAEPFGDATLPAPPGPVNFTIAPDDPGPQLINLTYDTGIR